MTSRGKHSESGAKGVNDAAEFPAMLRLAMDASTQTLAGTEHSTAVLGGSPLRLLRLTAPADAVFLSLVAGDSIAEAAALSNKSNRTVAQLARRLLATGIANPRWPATNSIDIKQVTIVIPVFQRAESLRRLLASPAATTAAVHEIIVVDDGSTDDSGAVAKSFGARVIRHQKPRGPAAARNAGLQAVSTEFVAFLDSDCSVEDGWLLPLLQHFHDPQVALVAPRIGGLVSDDTVRANILRAYEHVRSSLDLGPNEGPVMPKTRVAYVPAAALVGRVSVLQGIGGFTESMLVGEDVDLVWRLHDLGYVIRYEPTSVVRHDHRTSPIAFVKRRFQYGTSAAALAVRHPGNVPPLAVSAWSAASWGLFATATPAGIVTGFGTAIVSASALPRKLTALADPKKVAWRLAGRGHLGAGRQIGSAIWRSYLPLVLAGSMFSRRFRGVLLLSALAPNLLEWKERRPIIDPIRYVGIRLLDDASYCAGVWKGCFDERTLGPLIPDLTSWPGRRRDSAIARIGSKPTTNER